MITNKDLKRRIIDISYKKKLSHIGSCLTAVDIIDDIYSKMDLENDRFVLSSGHAGLALYVVLEKYYGFNAEELFDKHGVHPNRDLEHRIYSSSGSLGHGLGIAIGMALSSPERKIYCLMSDGECAEGSVYEALNFYKANGNNLSNLHVQINSNTFGGYSELDFNRIQGAVSNVTFDKYAQGQIIPMDNIKYTYTVGQMAWLRQYAAEKSLGIDLRKMIPEPVTVWDWLTGLEAHYHVLNDEEHKVLMGILV